MNLHSLMLILQNSYYFSMEGTLDEIVTGSLVSAISGSKQQAVFTYYWKIRKSNFSKSFNILLRKF